jgi:hypothetical protein
MRVTTQNGQITNQSHRHAARAKMVELTTEQRVFIVLNYTLDCISKSFYCVKLLLDL